MDHQTNQYMDKSNTEKSIHDFQELVRILDATLYKVDSKSMLTGHNTLDTIIHFIDYPGMKEKVGDHFYNFILEQHDATLKGFYNKETSSYIKNPNVREQVKKILMYPTTSYEPMLKVNVPDTQLELIKKELKKFRFSLRIFDRKVYAMHVENSYVDSDKQFHNDYRMLIMSKLGDQIKDHCKSVGDDESKLIPNPEPQHITIINSNVVTDCDFNEVSNFVDEFTTQIYPAFNVEFGDIKTTISNDWSLFSRCYVITIKSNYIDKFVQQFNEKFKDKLKKPINPALHTTFAIVPRTIPNLF